MSINPVSLGLNKLVEYRVPDNQHTYNKLTAVGETQMTQGVDIECSYYEKQWVKH